MLQGTQLGEVRDRVRTWVPLTLKPAVTAPQGVCAKHPSRHISPSGDPRWSFGVFLMSTESGRCHPARKWQGPESEPWSGVLCKASGPFLPILSRH